MIDLATVKSVTADGIQLKFDNEDETTSKYYKFNKSITFSANDRVVCFKHNGTYIVAFKI